MLKMIIFSSLFLVFSMVQNAGAGVVISYGYSGKFGMYGIADSARAEQDGILIGEAEAIELNKSSSGYGAELKVRETLYHPQTGRFLYSGYVIFKTTFGSQKVKEIPINGKKPFDVFRSWPMGR